MVGPGTNEERPLLAFALHALLGAAGAYAAHELPRASLDFATLSGLFVALAVLALALFRRSMLGSAFYVCIPAAVVLQLRGVRDGGPWFVVALVAIFGQLGLQRLRYSREKARQEKTLAEIKTRAPRPPSTA
jgi:hypothetical protein